MTRPPLDAPPAEVVSKVPLAAPRTEAAPKVPLAALDQLWFQVAGTVCNLRCRHCFISCSPENHDFWFLRRDEVAVALRESVGLGVKEYYFTGGEPFMNRELTGILEDTLALGPATVLTNGTLLPPRAVAELVRIAAGSPYSLELRVSLDGVTQQSNDAIRGEGAFARALDGIERLVQAGFLPIVTAMQSWPDHATAELLSGFRSLLGGVGYDRVRLKILPPLRIGAEADRTGSYGALDRVTSEMMHGYDTDLLLCSRARLVTARGVWVCPILLDSESGRLGATLDEAVSAPAELAEQACFTCWTHGAICSNMPALGAAASVGPSDPPNPESEITRR